MAWQLNINTSRDYNGTVTNYAPQVLRIGAFRGAMRSFAFAAEPSYIYATWRQGQAIPSEIQAGQKITLTDGVFSFEGRVRGWRLEQDAGRELWILDAVGFDDAFRNSFVLPEKNWANLSALDLASALLEQVRFPAALLEGNAAQPNYDVFYAGNSLPMVFPDLIALHTDFSQSSGAEGRAVMLAGDRWGLGELSVWDALAQIALFDFGRITMQDKILFLTGFELLSKRFAAASYSFDDSVAEISLQAERPISELFLSVRPRSIGDANTIVYEADDILLRGGETRFYRHAYTDTVGESAGVFFLCQNMTISTYAHPQQRGLFTGGGIEASIVDWNASSFEIRFYNPNPAKVFLSFALYGTPINLGDMISYSKRDSSQSVLYGNHIERIEIPFYSDSSNYLSDFADWLLYQEAYRMGMAWRIARRNPTSYPAINTQVEVESDRLGLANHKYTVMGERLKIDAAGCLHELFLEPSIRTFKAGDNCNTYPLGFATFSETIPDIATISGGLCT